MVIQLPDPAPLSRQPWPTVYGIAYRRGRIAGYDAGFDAGVELTLNRLEAARRGRLDLDAWIANARVLIDDA